MKVTLQLVGPDLPVDHVLAPWKTGATRAFDVATAEALMRERSDDFVLVDDKADKPAKGKKPAGGSDA